MSEQKDAELQKSINEIDARMYELLMQRTELVKQQSEANVVANSLGREAASIKRLLRAHKGDFPEYVIAKIWREILTASAFLNAKLKISLFGGQEHDGCLVNIVQEHFGSNVECETFSSFGQVMNALTSGEAQLAVIAITMISIKNRGGALFPRLPANTCKLLPNFRLSAAKR